jgi:hypothetical protein
MAIHKAIEKQFRKNIPEEEKILATVSSRNIMGDENDRYCITEKKIGIVHKPGLFQWKYSELLFENINKVVIEKGVFKSTIFILMSDKYELPLMNIDNNDAKEFYEILQNMIINMN